MAVVQMPGDRDCPLKVFWLFLYLFLTISDYQSFLLLFCGSVFSFNCAFNSYLNIPHTEVAAQERKATKEGKGLSEKDTGGQPSGFSKASEHHCEPIYEISYFSRVGETKKKKKKKVIMLFYYQRYARYRKSSFRNNQTGHRVLFILHWHLMSHLFESWTGYQS